MDSIDNKVLLRNGATYKKYSHDKVYAKNLQINSNMHGSNEKISKWRKNHVALMRFASSFTLVNQEQT